MQLASKSVLSQPPLAAMPQLSEKPRLGFATKKTAWNPGPNVCNFTVTLGLQVAVVENGVRKTYSARYYNPATGRFLSRDPEDGVPTDPASLHKYLYVGGDPVNALDPMGREEIVEYSAANRKSGFQLHHIVEQRFGRLFGGLFCTLAAVLTVEEHQAITNAWRRAIPYGIFGTGLATIAQVFAEAEQIYANSPEMAAALQECKALAGL